MSSLVPKGLLAKNNLQPAPPKILLAYSLIAAVAWTILVAVSWQWNLWDQDRGAIEIARVHATTAFEKDLSYRRWVADHIVYVRLEDGVTPNPYLQVPERDISSTQGALTLVNPATMSRQVYELESKSSKLRSHITSLNPLRPENAPDDWEVQALKAFRRGEQEVCSIDRIDGAEYMRLMRPLRTEQSCLRCHAEQGYELGQIRGGISVSVPMEPLRRVADAHKNTLLAGHLGLWLLGLVGIGVARMMLSRQIRNRMQVERDLENSESTSRLLAERNARLDAEKTLAATRAKLQIAATLQKRLLPRRVPQLDGYDFAAVLHPCDETAGDFYDFLVLNDGSLAVVLGDVSGHGIDAALLMSTALGHLRVLATQCCDAADLLRRLNQLIAQLADDRFVTVFVAQLDVESGALSYASAGHPGYLIKEDGSSQVLDSPCVPLGILPELDITTSPRIVLQPGQMVLLHTDGLSEATDAEDRPFGVSRILEKVAADRTCPADVIASQLCSEIQRYSGGVGQRDDMSVVVFKLNASQTQSGSG